MAGTDEARKVALAYGRTLTAQQIADDDRQIEREETHHRVVLDTLVLELADTAEQRGEPAAVYRARLERAIAGRRALLEETEKRRAQLRRAVVVVVGGAS